MCIPVYYTVLRDHTGLSPPHTKALTASFPVQPPPKKKKIPKFPKILMGEGQFLECAIWGPPRVVRDKILATVP